MKIITLEALEKRHILAVLTHFKGNKAKAAEALGVSVKTIYNKLDIYGDIAVELPIEAISYDDTLPVGAR